MLRAAKLVVIIPGDDFTCVDIIRELEKTRMNNDIDIPIVADANVNSTLYITNQKGEFTPINEDSFTVFVSKKKRTRKVNVVCLDP